MNLRSISFRLTTAALFFLAAGSVFAQTGGIKGRVRANSGGGIANASVSLTKGSEHIKTVKTASDGSFEMRGISPGFYGLRVEADGYASGSMFGFEIKKDKIRDLGDKLFLRVDQGTLVIIRGSVFFKEGTSVADAKVRLERVNADGSAKEVASTNTSTSGEFIFRQPPSGAKYRITAKYKGVSGTTEVTVENPAVYQVAVSLDLSGADN
ncbi:MAG: carboxypeptidase regulatory-like domain-containing protein [Acidobacteria bacterium]|nr:carboxypeptidase regulatory-like domain-containing protein [Acidobacteriota bacterium]